MEIIFTSISKTIEVRTHPGIYRDMIPSSEEIRKMYTSEEIKDQLLLTKIDLRFILDLLTL